MSNEVKKPSEEPTREDAERARERLKEELAEFQQQQDQDTEAEEDDEEEEDRERQQEIFKTLETSLLCSLDFSVLSGGRRSTVDGALAGAIAIFIQRYHEEGGEGSWLKEDLVPRILNWIENDRQKAKPPN